MWKLQITGLSFPLPPGGLSYLWNPEENRPPGIVLETMPSMRKKPPRQASLDEIHITREGETAVIEFADPNVSVSHVNVGPELGSMSDAAVLELFNAMLEAPTEIAAGFDNAAVEIPPGRPQIRFHEDSGRWVPRGQILRCHIEEDEESRTVIYIDDQELGLDAFSDLLKHYDGWGMRIAFVPEDEVTEQPEIEVREPDRQDDRE